MKPLKTCSTLLFLLFATAAFTQVEISGDIRFADTTQTHILTTHSGDRMIGRVIGFDETEVRFLMLGNTLNLPISTVKNIEVKNAGTVPPAFSEKQLEEETKAALLKEQKIFHYKIKLSDSTRTAAYLASFTDQKLSFISESDSTFQLELGQIVEMELLNRASMVENQLLVTTDLYEFRGMLTKYENGTFHFLTTKDGKIKFTSGILNLTIERDDAKEFKPPKFSGERPFLRNFIAPTGFTLRKGESEYRNTQIFFNTLDHGLADHVTVGVGLMTVFTANAVSGRLKLGADLGDNLNVAAGGQAGYGFVFGLSENFSFYNYYGAFTVGSNSHNITGSLGRLRSSDNDEYINQFSLAGSFLTGKKGRVFVELIHLRDNDDFSGSTLINLGGSWFKNKVRIDFGLSLIGAEGEVIVPFPIAAYSHFF